MVLLSVTDDAGVVVVTSDNRVTLWDAGSGELKHTVQENNRLVAIYSAVAYGATKKSTSKSSKTVRLVALGNKEGKLNVWDVVKGEHILEDLANQESSTAESITDIAFSPDCQSIFVAYENDKYVYQFDSHNGDLKMKFRVGKHGACKLCVSPDGKRLLTASLQILLWDVESGSKIKKFSGHESPVRCLAFSSTGAHFVSGCENRFLSIWTCEVENEDHESSRKKSRKSKSSKNDADEKHMAYQRSPSFILSSPCSPSWVGIQPISKSNKSEVVMACGEDQFASLWSFNFHDANSAHSEETQPGCVLENKGSTGEVLAVLFNGSNSKTGLPEEVTLVRNSPLRPFFQRQSITKNGEFVKKIVLDNAAKKARLISGQENSEVSPEGDIIPEDGEGLNEQPISKAEGKKVAIVKAGNSNIPTPTPLVSPDACENEKTMGERIRELSEKLGKHIEDASNDADELENIKSGKKRPRDGSNSMTLSSVLEQALQSNDNNLVEVCLRNVDRQIVTDTVSRLPSSRVLQFLNTIVQKFESRPARGNVLIVWIKALLDQHASFLAKVPDLADSLSGLHQIIETRLTLFSRFLKLQGRLEFVLSQVALRANQRAAESSRAPAVVYDEAAPAESESEDESEEMSDIEEAEKKVEQVGKPKTPKKNKKSAVVEETVAEADPMSDYEFLDQPVETPKSKKKPSKKITSEKEQEESGERSVTEVEKSSRKRSTKTPKRASENGGEEGEVPRTTRKSSRIRESKA